MNNLNKIIIIYNDLQVKTEKKILISNFSCIQTCD